MSRMQCRDICPVCGTDQRTVSRVAELQDELTNSGAMIDQLHSELTAEKAKTANLHVAPDKVVLKDSPIHGKGLFANQDIPKASLVINWLNDGDAYLIPEALYLGAIKDDTCRLSGVRFTGDVFLCGDRMCKTDYINHSDEPNLLHHMGLCYALRDIKSGEEFTLDYRLLNSEHERDVVQGYPAHKAMLLTTDQLLNLFNVSRRYE